MTIRPAKNADQPDLVGIRPATLADVPRLARVHVDAWRDTYDGLVPADHLAHLTYAFSELTWARILSDADPTKHCLVWENEGGVVQAFAAFGPVRGPIRIPDSALPEPTLTDPSLKLGPQGEIYAIYMDSALRRQGLGRSFFDSACNILRNDASLTLLVWCLEANPARHFYQSLGGQPLFHESRDIGGALLPEVGFYWHL